MPQRSRVTFHDNRGRFRKPQHYERNRYFTVDTLSKGLANFAFKTTEMFGEKAQEFADMLVEYAQTNAPWEDRTGAARSGLVAEVNNYDEQIEIDLQHTADYGIWLEIRWGAKYAIIIPTLETMGPKLFDLMEGMLGDIKYYE